MLVVNFVFFSEIEEKIKAKSEEIDLTLDPEDAYTLAEDDGEEDEFDIRLLDVDADDK